MNINENEITAFIGPSGCGKSTLLKSLNRMNDLVEGVKIEGKILLDNVDIYKDMDATVLRKRVGMVFQKPNPFPMSIYDNVAYGPRTHGIKQKSRLDEIVEQSLRSAAMWDEVKDRLKKSALGMSGGQQQRLCIARAFSVNPEVILLDEPTSALTESETENLLNLLKEFRNKGITCIYISHKLNEIFEIADRITVLRDGHTVTTRDAVDLNEDQLITLMVGRELTQRFPREEHKSGNVMMEVKNWTVYDPEIQNKKVIDNVSFQVKKGEILGISGLMGAGRTELFMSIFGCFGSKISGELWLDGVEIKKRNPSDIIKEGISYLSEDRKGNGLILMQSIKQNISVASLKSLSKMNVINESQEIKDVEKYISSLHIKTPSIEQKVENLSGGNQQKVVLGKWLMTQPKVLILDEPTRGIDVGAKYEIYTIMNQLVNQGVCVIMISSELPELLGMSDRILVMCEGKLTGELQWQEADQEKVIYYATGGK